MKAVVVHGRLYTGGNIIIYVVGRALMDKWSDLKGAIYRQRLIRKLLKLG